jgi:hypothetical protein
MEAYYKERKKQLNSYLRKIKKLSKAGQVEEVAKLKKEYTQLLIKPPTFKRDAYMTEQDYIQSLNKSIRENENKFVELKLDICYDLHDELKRNENLKNFKEYENTLSSLRKKRDALLSKKRERELLEERTRKQKQEQLKGIMESYFFLENEDKKVTYKEIEKLSSEMANPNRKVIAYEIEHNDIEYRLTQLYDQVYPVKISV